jgi:hypothetical protein
MTSNDKDELRWFLGGPPPSRSKLAEWLRERGYSGIACDDPAGCACFLNNLIPCDGWDDSVRPSRRKEEVPHV